MFQSKLQFTSRAVSLLSRYGKSFCSLSRITMSAPLQYSFNPPSGSRTEWRDKTSIDYFLSRYEVDMGELSISAKSVRWVQKITTDYKIVFRQVLSPSTDMRLLWLVKSSRASSWYWRVTPSSETTIKSLVLERKTQPSSLAAQTRASSSGDAAW